MILYLYCDCSSYFSRSAAGQFPHSCPQSSFFSLSPLRFSSHLALVLISFIKPHWLLLVSRSRLSSFVPFRFATLHSVPPPHRLFQLAFLFALLPSLKLQFANYLRLPTDLHRERRDPAQHSAKKPPYPPTSSLSLLTPLYPSHTHPTTAQPYNPHLHTHSPCVLRTHPGSQ